jgi:hypothetical protein
MRKSNTSMNYGAAQLVRMANVTGFKFLQFFSGRIGIHDFRGWQAPIQSTCFLCCGKNKYFVDKKIGKSAGCHSRPGSPAARQKHGLDGMDSIAALAVIIRSSCMASVP